MTVVLVSSRTKSLRGSRTCCAVPTTTSSASGACARLHCFVGKSGLLVKRWEVGVPSLALHTVDHGVTPPTGTPAARTRSACKGDASNACARCRWVIATMAAVAAAAAVVFVVTRPLQAAVEKEKRKVPTSEFTHSLICFHPFIHCTLQCFAAPSFTSCAADSVTTAAAGSVGSGGS